MAGKGGEGIERQSSTKHIDTFFPLVNYYLKKARIKNTVYTVHCTSRTVILLLFFHCPDRGVWEQQESESGDKCPVCLQESRDSEWLQLDQSVGVKPPLRLGRIVSPVGAEPSIMISYLST